MTCVGNTLVVQGKEPISLNVQSYSTVEVANIPLPDDGAVDIAEPQDPWMQLYTVRSKGAHNVSMGRKAATTTCLLIRAGPSQQARLLLTRPPVSPILAQALATKRDKLKDCAAVETAALAERKAFPSSMVEVRATGKTDTFYITVDQAVFGPFARIR